MTTRRFEEKDYNTDSLDLGIWRRIFKLLFVHKKRLVAIFVLNVFVAFFDTAIPYMNKIAIDTFASGKGTDQQLRIFAIIFLVGSLLQAFFVFIYFTQAGRLEVETSYGLRKQLFEKLQSLSYSFFDVTPAGWLISRLTSDISRLAEILSWSLMDFGWGLMMMIGITIVMFMTNVKLALFVLMVVPFLAWAARYFNIRILKNYRDVRRVNSRITNGFSEGISGAQTTKTLVLEEHNLEEFNKETTAMRNASIKAISLSSLLYPMVMWLSSFSIATLLMVGGHDLLVGVLEFGTLVMFTQYAQQFFDPLNQIASLAAELQMAQASAERVLGLLDEEIKIVDKEEVIQKYGTIFEPKEENYEPIEGNITFEHVGFHYIENEEVLKDFNLEVKAGETIALVGETGSGKSTIVNLLCRFYEPTSGTIKIDGVDYKERSLGWLHSQIGYVLQSPHLFSGTIKENIRFGNLEASDEEIIEVCKMVNAHEFIMKFEKGYDTDVGEGGSRLSTGQKQMISFARAVIAKPKIYILDEATSSVDTETEKIIQDTIEHVMKGSTSFVVAHRLSTIVNADKILVIRNGKIIEMGRHEELMEKKGYYHRLYTNQFTERLESEIMGVKKEEAWS